MKEKIEEILDMLFIEETKYKVNVAQSSTVSNTVPDIRSSPEYSAVNIVGKEAVVKLLSNLIQQEREEAVKNTILSIMSKVPTIMPHDKPDYILRSDFDRAIKEVESEGKK